MVQSRKYHNVVIDSAGNPVSGASVTVKHVGTGTSATLYSDEGTTTIANPVTTDSLGRFAFYVADGDYDLEIVKSGVINVTVPDVSMVDPKRVFELTLNDDAYFLMNSWYDRAAAQWKRRDTGKLAWAVALDRTADQFKILRAAAGANPITWTILQSLDNAGRWNKGVVLLDRSTTQVPADNTASPVTLYSFSIPGGLLSTNKGVRLHIFGQRSNNNVANNPTLRVKLGATNLVSIASDPNTSAGTLIDYHQEIVLYNNGAANAQKAAARHYIPGATAGGWVQSGTATEDTTSAKTLAVEVQWGTADANNRWRREMAILEFLGEVAP